MKYKVGDIVILYNKMIAKILRVDNGKYYYIYNNQGESWWVIESMEKNSRLATKLEQALL